LKCQQKSAAPDVSTRIEASGGFGTVGSASHSFITGLAMTENTDAQIRHIHDRRHATIVGQYPGWIKSLSW
jgi:hypothetical protein